MALVESILAGDARALERALLEHVREQQLRWRGSARHAPETLTIVVASGALREHLLARLAGGLGALLGVRVVTLAGAGREILERAGGSGEAHDLACELLALRAARQEPDLAAALGQRADDWTLAAASIGDLLSAGLARHGGSEPENLCSRDPQGARAAALVRAAASAHAAALALGLARANDRLEQAAALLENGTASWPGCLALYGLDELTGQAAALARALASSAEARWFAQRPPGFPAPSERWFPDVPVRWVDDAPRGELAAYCAAGMRAEVREMAERVRRLLDAGTAPERIGVVARRLDDRAGLVRQTFDDLGIPFSGGSVSPAREPQVRALRVLMAMVELGESAPLDLWSEAQAFMGEAAARADVRLALRLHGVASLGALARAAVDSWADERGGIALPARGGRRDDGEGGESGESGEGGAEADGRSVGWIVIRDVLAAEVRRAAAFLAAIRQRRAAPLADHLSRLGDALACLAAPGSVLAGALETAGAALGRQAPASLPVDPAELPLLLERALAGELPALGGQGAGVRILEPEAARGLSFEHLFMLGANRGEFPATTREDPLLTDRERARLRERLAELELKRRRGDAERELFRRLLAAAEHVTVSWLASDEDGQPLARSPCMQALCFERGLEPRAVPRRREIACAGRTVLTEREHWLAAALTRPRSELAALAVLRGGAAARLAAHRLRVLDELDPDALRAAARARAGELAPFEGCLGREAPARREPGIPITRLESTARCPWRAHLERELGLRPVPDPLSVLPDVDALVLGNCVHGALERLLGAGAGRVPRPTGADVARVLLPAAERALADAAVHLPSLASGLARRARPFVERAIEILFQSAAPVELLGAEQERELEVAGAALRFRADLVLGPAEAQTLVDFKTGQPVSHAKTAETRAKHLRAGIARGTHLQAAAYAACAGSGRGAYWFLDPALDLAVAQASVEAGDGATREAFERAAAALSGSLRDGLAPPFLEDANGKAEACKHCAVDRACLRYDSGARRRLALTLRAAAGSAVDGALTPLARLWAGAEAED